jgi:3-methyladenine DNA glycosylase/8-oxoguanine DNA glycosylase
VPTKPAPIKPAPIKPAPIKPAPTQPVWTKLKARGEFSFGLTASVIARLPAHNGVDCFDETSQTLRRALHTTNGARVVTARPMKGGLEIDDDSPEARVWAIRAFGLELDPAAFYAVCANDPALSKAAVALVGLRPPLMDFWEAWVAAILGQQITLAFCLQQITAISRRYGGEVDGFLPDGTPHKYPLHPSPQQILTADEAGLLECKVSRRKTEYLKTVAQALLDGYFDDLFQRDGLERDVSEILEHLTALRGIGLWSARYWLATVGRLDFLAYGDAGLNSAYKLAYGSLDGIEAWGEALGPTRGWAYYYLIWHQKYFRPRLTLEP